MTALFKLTLYYNVRLSWYLLSHAVLCFDLFEWLCVRAPSSQFSLQFPFLLFFILLFLSTILHQKNTLACAIVPSEYTPAWVYGSSILCSDQIFKSNLTALQMTSIAKSKFTKGIFPHLRNIRDSVVRTLDDADVFVFFLLKIFQPINWSTKKDRTLSNVEC